MHPVSQRTHELSIAELSPGGEGVAIETIDGERRAVFVPGVLPGERIRAEVDASRRPARGRLLSVLDPSPARAAPPCPHVTRCGGCDWMHVAAEAQPAEHANVVSRLLGHPVTPHAAPRALGYRTRTRLHVEASRTGAITAGIFTRGSHEPRARSRIGSRTRQRSTGTGSWEPRVKMPAVIAPVRDASTWSRVRVR